MYDTNLFLTNVLGVEDLSKCQGFDLVAGGPCICYAKGNPLRLQLQDLTDVIIPCMVATLLCTPAFIYFQSHESDLMKDVLHYNPVNSDFNKMEENLFKGVEVFFSLCGLVLPEVHFIDTAKQQVKLLIDDISNGLMEQIPIEHLYGLYSAEKGGDYPKGTREEADLVRVYYRNLSLYCLELFRELYGFTNDTKFLLIENTTQRKAIEIIRNGQGKSVKALHYAPALNRQGKEMCKGNRNHKIELRSTWTQVMDRSAMFLNTDFKGHNFYNSLFQNIPLVEFIEQWKEKTDTALQS